MSKGVCLICGSKRDRGPYTKLCSSCFIQPCRRCGSPNLRGPKTVLCQDCKNLPPVDSSKVCRRCGCTNDRGGRTRICSACLEADSSQSKKSRTVLMNSEAKPGTKWCPECELYKEAIEFYTTKRGSGDSCKLCSSTKGRTRRLDKYGITEEEYLKIFNYQGGVCAICGNAPKAQKLHVDHDHHTNMVRGLLCLWCNHKVLGGAGRVLKSYKRL